jgi:hypothetical protein
MLTVIGLVLVLFAFVGVPLLVESIHSFLQVRTGVVGP